MSAPTTAEGAASVAAAALGALLGLFFRAWVGMLMIGALHHEVDEAVPALGYVETIWVIVALAVLVPGAMFSGRHGN